MCDENESSIRVNMPYVCYRIQKRQSVLRYVASVCRARESMTDVRIVPKCEDANVRDIVRQEVMRPK